MDMVDVVGTDKFVAWYDRLSDADTDAVTLGVDRLASAGVTLRFPYCSGIEGTDYPLRELRIQSKGRPIRVFYAFDPKRQAVLLIGGDKTGDDRFYDRMVPRAEKIWDTYLDELDD